MVLIRDRRVFRFVPWLLFAVMAIVALLSLAGVRSARGEAEVFLEVRSGRTFRIVLLVQDFEETQLPGGSTRPDDLLEGGYGCASGPRVADMLARDLALTDLFYVLRRRQEPDGTWATVAFSGEVPERPVEARITGEVRRRAGGVEIGVTVVDEKSQRSVLETKGVLRCRGPEADSWEIHVLCDRISKALTGTPGAAATRIVFVGKVDSGAELFLVDWDGTNLRQLSDLGSICVSPAWFPTGCKIAFASFVRGAPAVFEIEPATGQTELLCSCRTPAGIAYSPDGKWIAFSSSEEGNAEIYVAPVGDLSSRRRLTFSRAIDASPSWSPGGSKLVFTSDRTGTPQLYTISRDGTDLEQLTFEGSWNDSPDWSPLGDAIVFVSRIEGRMEIALVRPETGEWTQLTKGGLCENPKWAPDGRHVVFSRGYRGARSLFVLDVRSGRVRRLTPPGTDSYNPAWSQGLSERP